MEHQRSSSMQMASSLSSSSSNNSSVIRPARLERKTWIMALAIFTAVVCITGSAPYYLSTKSLVPSPSVLSSPSSSSKKIAKTVFSQNRVNGSWEDEMRHTMDIDKCIQPEAKGYHPNKKIPWTVFTSFPRSGNTHVRNLVEKSSGFYTSSIVCDDPDLERYFPAECNADNRFLLKAHFPVFQHEPLEETSKEYLDWWKKFDKVLWVQRNPFDAIFSLWNMMEMLESFQRGDNLHEARVDLPGGKLSWDNEKHRTKVFHLIYMYQQHFYYWRRVPLPTHHVLYEDLLGTNSLPTLMGIIQFLLPQAERPSLWRMICADEMGTAYKGKTSGPFYAYSKFDKKLQEHILNELAKPWCSAGYDRMMFEKLGKKPLDCHKIDLMS